MSAFSCCKRCLFALFIIAIFVVLIHGWLTYKSYLFTDKAISSIAVKYAASKGKKPVYVNIYYVNYMRSECRAVGLVEPPQQSVWVNFN